MRLWRAAALEVAFRREVPLSSAGKGTFHIADPSDCRQMIAPATGDSVVQREMSMPTVKKIETVKELSDRIARANLAIAGDYRGLNVADMTALRRALRDAGIELRVVKNTLFRRAAEQAGRPQVAEIAEGPTAIAFAYGDIVQPVRVLTEYLRTSRLPFTIKRAAMDGQILAAEDVQSLATLPSREQLIGQVAGAIISPLATLHYLLTATLRQFAGLVDARINQLEGPQQGETSVASP